MITQLKTIDVLNDYVAVMRVIDIPEGLEMAPEAIEKISNEGIVVGVGPEAKSVAVGDKVIFVNKRYFAMTPASGGYEGKTIIMVKSADLVVRIGRTAEYEFVGS